MVQKPLGKPNSAYRVVAKARDAVRARDFIWEIVKSDDPDGRAVTKSIPAFKSMEEAAELLDAAVWPDTSITWLPMSCRPNTLRRLTGEARVRGIRERERFTSQRLHAPSLDWLNFFIADVRGGLGPYVVVYLVVHQGWSPTATGLVTTVGGWLGLAAQTPIGALLDRTSRKRGALL